jgi:hypothetical protein
VQDGFCRPTFGWAEHEPQLFSALLQEQEQEEHEQEEQKEEQEQEEKKRGKNAQEKKNQTCLQRFLL